MSTRGSALVRWRASASAVDRIHRAPCGVAAHGRGATQELVERRPVRRRVEVGGRQVGRRDVAQPEEALDQGIDAEADDVLELLRRGTQAGLEREQQRPGDFGCALGDGQTRQLRRERVGLDGMEQDIERLADEGVVVLGDLVGRAELRLHRPQPQEPVGEAVHGADIGRVETGQRVQQMRPSRRENVGRGELVEEPLANPQPQLAGRLAGERDGGDAADRDAGRPVGGRDHRHQALDEHRGLAGARAGVDEHVAGALVDGGIARGLVGSRAARRRHLSRPRRGRRRP